ncbi:hypothetical protein WOLCODRAFT_138212 [Wolfiporia cocos MD-104 SS10]|uniref:Uncharacterized protein n=1 Tax=Wolfiporia cocos (strain MD-104) TaxID=742152 RepID=A0A2H3JZ39_WOLCO|nr:hypothetical protein WOLCODRAFT_138212 [Wolfiporia cocos MD-104 SS10]
MSASADALAPTVQQLQQVNAELQRRKVDAEKDRDLFRDLYGKASTHASEVTKENNTLQEQLTLVEGQLRDGLAMVRGTYEERVRKLEDEARRWKGMYDVLAARDRRTDDELRRRAALQPELEAENARLKEELQKLGKDYHQMEDVLVQLAEQEEADGIPPVPKVSTVKITSVATTKVVE